LEVEEKWGKIDKFGVRGGAKAGWRGEGDISEGGAGKATN